MDATKATTPRQLARPKAGPAPTADSPFRRCGKEGQARRWWAGGEYSPSPRPLRRRTPRRQRPRSPGRDWRTPAPPSLLPRPDGTSVSLTWSRPSQPRALSLSRGPRSTAGGRGQTSCRGASIRATLCELEGVAPPPLSGTLPGGGRGLPLRRPPTARTSGASELSGASPGGLPRGGCLAHLAAAAVLHVVPRPRPDADWAADPRWRRLGSSCPAGSEQAPRGALRPDPPLRRAAQSPLTPLRVAPSLPPPALGQRPRGDRDPRLAQLVRGDAHGRGRSPRALESLPGSPRPAPLLRPRPSRDFLEKAGGPCVALPAGEACRE